MDRRKFLQLLGIGAVVAPAASVALPKVAKSLTDIEAARKWAAIDKMVNPPLAFNFNTGEWVGITCTDEYAELLGNHPRLLMGT